ncbi:hypothetical protein [Lentzea flava]|uniref:Uncharacterized protein n=1 Tax=Lentzea flava TaxID=103732 RepID=A0ABQ2VL10_9PSEU|nr:hypothetical protein [Lentzea flava]GGU87877.1 hypothetical protein GCM10010178_91940 [Lentzea flava]
MFCKHCVAASLAWLEQGGELGSCVQKPLSGKRLQFFLRGCGQEWLIEQLMTVARSDRALRAQLAVAAVQENAFDDRDIRNRLERAIDAPHTPPRARPACSGSCLASASLRSSP